VELDLLGHFFEEIDYQLKKDVLLHFFFPILSISVLGEGTDV